MLHAKAISLPAQAHKQSSKDGSYNNIIGSLILMGLFQFVVRMWYMKRGLESITAKLACIQ